MFASGLPPPPAASDLDLAWLLNNRGVLAAYMQQLYALQRLQIVVIKDGVRQPPQSVQLAADSAIVEIKV